MARPIRLFPGNAALHVLNRGNERRRLFHEPDDYDDFLRLMSRSLRARPVRLLAYALMPNHWHLVVWPEHSSQLSQFMHHLTGLHAARFRYRSSTQGLGHVYQGRFRAFPITHDARYLRTIRYVEANPVRAGLVAHAEDWYWTSLTERLGRARLIVDGPVPLPPSDRWRELVNDHARATEDDPDRR